MRILSMLFMILALSACAPQPSQPSPATLLNPGEISIKASATADPLVEQITSLAISDLSTRLSLDPSIVNVLSIESVDWTDTALGCPRPGEVYVQKAVPGFRLRLEANGQEYTYHTDQSTLLILCTEDELPSFPATPDEIDDGKPWMPVD